MNHQSTKSPPSFVSAYVQFNLFLLTKVALGVNRSFFRLNGLNIQMNGYILNLFNKSLLADRLTGIFVLFLSVNVTLLVPLNHGVISRI